MDKETKDTTINLAKKLAKWRKKYEVKRRDNYWWTKD